MPDLCNELLTEAGCVRRAGHAPPHTAERRLAELLDERDELAHVVARNRQAIALLEDARRPGVTPLYVIVPVSDELLLGDTIDDVVLEGILGNDVRKVVRDALERGRGEARP